MAVICNTEHLATGDAYQKCKVDLKQDISLLGSETLCLIEMPPSVMAREGLISSLLINNTKFIRSLYSHHVIAWRQVPESSQSLFASNHFTTLSFFIA